MDGDIVITGIYKLRQKNQKKYRRSALGNCNPWKPNPKQSKPQKTQKIQKTLSNILNNFKNQKEIKLAVDVDPISFN